MAAAAAAATIDEVVTSAIPHFSAPTIRAAKTIQFVAKTPLAKSPLESSKVSPPCSPTLEDSLSLYSSTSLCSPLDQLYSFFTSTAHTTPMSTQQRKPKKRSLLSRILCCSSPDLEEQPSHQRPSSQDSKKATQQLQNTPADPISTSPQRPPISAQSESEKIDQTTDVNQSQDAVVPQDRDVTSEKSQAPLTAVFGHAASPISGLEPPLERNDEDTLTVLPLSTSSHESATEEKLALTEDEPLVPASAAMTATEPVDERSSNGIVVSSAPVEDESIWLLPKLSPELQGRKCLVLDLDETLVHSSFKVIHQADFVVPVEIDGIYHNVYVIKRPGVDDFMLEMGKHFEIVVFTASLAKYADPVLDILDVHKVVHHRLFRESCHNHQGNYVKDLSQLGRDLKTAIIIDNSPASYVFHPAHAVPISSWFNDIHDTELTDLIPFLKDLTTVEDISQILELSLQ